MDKSSNNMYGKLYFRIPFTLIVNLDSKFYISFLMYFVKSSEQSLFFLNIYNERPFPHDQWNDRKTMKTTSKYEFSFTFMVKLLQSHEGHSITSEDSYKEKLITPDQQTENIIRKK